MTDRTDRQAEIDSDAAEILAMTADEHVRVAARIFATPVDWGDRAPHYLCALVHLGFAAVKGGAR